MRTIQLHPLSLLVGGAAALLAFVTMGQQVVSAVPGRISEPGQRGKPHMGAVTKLAPSITTPWCPPLQESRLEASNGAAGDGVGSGVSVDGDFAVSGAPLHDLPGKIDAGCAYVFQKTAGNWSETGILTASDGEAGDQFGAATRINGDTLVVSAPADDAGATDSGSAYVFVRTGSTWSEQAKLVPHDPDPGSGFGDLAIWEDTIVVGAPAAEAPGVPDAGAAYVFVRSGTTWTEQAKLTASDADWDRFGFGLALVEDTLIIGSSWDDHSGSFNNGSAYVFERVGTTWTETTKLLPSNPSGGDTGGTALAFDGSTLVFSSVYNTNQNGYRAGAAYVFSLLGGVWSEQAKLVASDGSAEDHFGAPAGLQGGLIVVGAPDYDHSGFDHAGAVYPFVCSGATWTECPKVLPSDPASHDYFSASLSLSGSSLLVGAPGDDNANGSDAGSLYIFELASLQGQTYCTAGYSASGCLASIAACGQPSATASSGFHLSATSVEGAKDGMFFYGVNGRQAVTWGTGFQCVVPPVMRGPLQAGIGTANACDGVFSLDLNARWCPTCPKAVQNPGPGTVMQAQFWYRDPWNTATTKTTTLSDAIEFTVGP